MAGRPKTAMRRKNEAAMLGDPEFWKKMFNVMANGESVTAAVHHFGVSYHAALAHITHDPELKKEYEAAQVARALYHVDKIEEIAKDCGNGSVHDNGKKVALDAHKWVASKLDPNRWGDRQRIDMTTLDLNQLHLDAIRSLGKEEDEIPVNPQREELQIQYDR